MSWKQPWPKDRAEKAVELRRQGLSHAQIAKSLGVSRGSASAFLHRVRAA